jgi:hypothetical protein
MGGFGATAIRVTGNGDVRIAGHPAAAVRGAPSQSDLRADVRSCGMAVCAAFGVDPAGAPAPPNVPPGLVVTMRSMASGAMGPAADRAQGALREMAAALLAPDRMAAAQSELAVRAGGRETPALDTFLPKEAAAQAPAPAAPYVPAAPRDETPVRAPVSYDAPPRSMQTYPAIPAPTYTSSPVPAAPATTPAPPEPRRSDIPTWSEAPARTSVPDAAVAAAAVAAAAAATAAAAVTPAVAPPPVVPPPARTPSSTTPPTPSPYVTNPPVVPKEPVAGPGATRSPFDTGAPASSTSTLATWFDFPCRSAYVQVSASVTRQRLEAAPSRMC